MAMEIEIKLRVDSEETASRLERDSEVHSLMLDGWRDVDMLSRYFDTPGHVMQRNKWSLRLRSENGVSVAAFKARGTSRDALLVRQEVQAHADSIEAAIPLLVAGGAPSELLELGGFDESCRVEFLRRFAGLRLPDRSVVEMAIDRGVLRASGKTARLLELELELLSGEPGQMLALSDALRLRYGLTPEQASKHVRALMLARSSGKE